MSAEIVSQNNWINWLLNQLSIDGFYIKSRGSVKSLGVFMGVYFL
jgi:hypothetical protein